MPSTNTQLGKVSLIVWTSQGSVKVLDMVYLALSRSLLNFAKQASLGFESRPRS